ncbi:MAG: hypothetical protein J2P28_19040 [Actinobacteria bacterium]|nr:hypothetical protein [Actinomycetota bacterium]MBO0837587.1 hypothetical protein [Actinomycetota bacterium]
MRNKRDKPEVPGGDNEALERRFLGPLRSRYPWVVWGLIVQVLGVGSVAVVMWRSIHNQSVSNHVTAQMIKFAWHSELHTRAGLAVLVAGAVVYAVGSVVMARPYVTRPVTLFIAVPIAAVAGMLVLGVLAIVLTALLVLLSDIGDVGGWGPGGDFGGGWGPRRDRSRRRRS